MTSFATPLPHQSPTITMHYPNQFSSLSPQRRMTSHHRSEKSNVLLQTTYIARLPTPMNIGYIVLSFVHLQLTRAILLSTVLRTRMRIKINSHPPIIMQLKYRTKMRLQYIRTHNLGNK